MKKKGLAILMRPLSPVSDGGLVSNNAYPKWMEQESLFITFHFNTETPTSPSQLKVEYRDVDDVEGPGKLQFEFANGADFLSALLLLSMEMNFNGEGNGGAEAHGFDNFSIREFGAEVRRNDWRNCWPFNSFGGSRVSIRRVEGAHAVEFPVSPSFSGQSGSLNIETSDNTPKNTESLNLLDIEVSNAQQVQCETHEEATVPIETREANAPIEVDENMTAEPNNDGAKSTMVSVDDKPRRKPRKYIKLSCHLKELTGPYVDFNVRLEIVRADNVKINFTAECEDLDDVPLDTTLRKQKSVEICQSGDSKEGFALNSLLPQRRVKGLWMKLDSIHQGFCTRITELHLLEVEGPPLESKRC